MSKHGGSPESGLVLPAGIEQHQPAVPGGVIIAPEIVKQAAERKERARQFERRRIALELLPAIYSWNQTQDDGAKQDVARALAYADEMMAQTGGEV